MLTTSFPAVLSRHQDPPPTPRKVTEVRCGEYCCHRGGVFCFRPAQKTDPSLISWVITENVSLAHHTFRSNFKLHAGIGFELSPHCSTGVVVAMTINPPPVFYRLLDDLATPFSKTPEAHGPSGRRSSSSSGRSNGSEMRRCGGRVVL